MSNSMMTIYPYKDHGDWVFDDESVDLRCEPFVFGVPEMIDAFVAGIAEADKGFKLIFSAGPFPGYQAEMNWVREEYGGNWYVWTKTGQEGWLCPALLKYFDVAPLRIFCRADPLRR